MNEMKKRPDEWMDDEVIQACLDYTTRSELRHDNESAYICIAYRNLWDRLTWLRDRHSERARKIGDDYLIEMSKQFTGEGRGAFQKERPDLYHAAYRRGLLDDMPWLEDTTGRTSHQILMESKNYKTMQEFIKADKMGYDALKARGVLDAITWLEDGTEPEYLKEQREERKREVEGEPPAEPVKESEMPDIRTYLFDQSKAYKTVAEFGVKDPDAFAEAERLGLLKEMTWLVDDRV